MEKTRIPDYSSQNMVSEILITSRFPVMIWISFSYVVSMIVHNWNGILVGPSLIFSILITVHMLLYWFSNSIVQHNKWLYIFSQAAVIYGSAYIFPGVNTNIVIGSLPILIAQSIPIFQRIYRVLLVFIFIFFFCFYLVFDFQNDTNDWLIIIAILSFSITLIIFYSISYNRQVNARARMEYYLRKLEAAYQKVEELTLITERQRMARDLHDTLAQDLAGLIMKLEAMDVHLTKNNTARAQEIIQNAMIQAREALRDARKAIDNLRENTDEEVHFGHAAINIIHKFEKTSPTQFDYDINPLPALPALITENSLYILSECLANITKHALATQAKVHISETDNQLMMIIRDNGKGFNTKNIGIEPGKYGLMGLYERSQLIGGKINIHSTPGSGTTITVAIPL